MKNSQNNEDLVTEDHSKKEGRKVLWTLLAFFGFIACVDGFFVYKALSTHTGVVAKNTYEIGVNYNEIIAEAERRKDEQRRNTQPE